MRAAVAVAAAALFAVAQGWPSSCLSECTPTAGNLFPTGTSVGARQTCPLASNNAYLTQIAGPSCPGGCAAVASESDCENAASWLQLGADGEPDACPTAAELVGAGGLWDASAVNSATHLSGCSWNPRTPTGPQLVYNTNNNAILPDAIERFRICVCPSMAALPDYVASVSGATCPGVARQIAQGANPSCHFITAELTCETAAGALGLVDASLQMCMSGCGTPTPTMAMSVNSPEIGEARPAGCHYRYNIDDVDSHLWFNPHYNMSTLSPAKPPGEGLAPDYLLCGCGDVVPPLPQNLGCMHVGSNKRSRACGVGQYCLVDGANASQYDCVCEFPLSTPDTGRNAPARCREEIPTKYIHWVSGTSCPFDERRQCLPPPTRERCEIAATMLGLADTTASLPHSESERQAPDGCHYRHGASSPLRYNMHPLGNVEASLADSMICECIYYPMFVAELSGTGCGNQPGDCRPVDTKFECGLAAGAVGIPVPASFATSVLGTSQCVQDPAAGPSSPYLPCGHASAPQCNGSFPMRPCEWIDGMQMLVGPHVVSAPPPTDGCTYHTGAAQLQFINNTTVVGVNTNSDFRLCDCANEALHDIITPRLGFECAGKGDCAKASVADCTGQQEDLCVELEAGGAVLRADRYQCSSLLTEPACLSDAAVCQWDNSSGTCDWVPEPFVQHGEINAFFSDCLEHCLLLCKCTGVSFFTVLGNSPGDRGGCDFFSGVISGGTNESKPIGKGPGDWKCYRNIPELPPTPAPTYDCPECNIIPTEGECSNQFGCAWSSENYCCCEPFISGCTDAWHTNTSNQETCESTTDDGRQCAWVTGGNGTGVCELPITACVDVWVKVVLNGTNTTAQSTAVGIINTIKAQNPGEVSAGCGSNASFQVGPNSLTVEFPIDLSGNRSCGQATRWAAQAEAKLEAGGSAGGFPIFSAMIVSNCWKECTTNPLCPKATPAPTPEGETETAAPQGVNQDPPTAGPTLSPQDGCPVGLTVANAPGYACRCDPLDCEDPPLPFLTSSYKYCSNCDSRLTGGVHFTCPVCTPIDAELTISCPNTWEACDILIWVYNQKGCAGPVNGGFIENLPAEGWTTSRCLPEFCGNSTCLYNTSHRTIALHKQIPGGGTEPIPATTDPTMYFSVVVDQGRLCSTYQDQGSCENPIGLCLWDDGQCVTHLNTCGTPPSTHAPAPAPGPEGRGGDGVDKCCMLGTPTGDCSIAETA